MDKDLARLAELSGPVVLGSVGGIASKAGPGVQALIAWIPIAPRQFLSMPLADIVSRLAAAARRLGERGARMIGMGDSPSARALASRVAPFVGPGISAGNAFTAFSVVVGLERALRARDRDPDRSTVCVIGAMGSVGHGVAEHLARRRSCRLCLWGRHRGRLDRAAAALECDRARLRVETDLEAALAQADVVVTASNRCEPFIDASWFRRNAVVCDLGHPANVVAASLSQRPDVLLFDECLAEVPGEPRFDFPAALLAGQVLQSPSFAEATLLALAGATEDFALRRVSASQVQTIATLAVRHGFGVGALCWSGQAVLPAQELQSRGAGPGVSRA
ncbi:MAG: saccharopine dehydrogenase NADP-binding domain-containing protein [Anaerolineae bacterium]|nr:saccharopine dehydrogenase NADP-binding domain-containing protein [Anaerolineae bacterium]